MVYNEQLAEKIRKLVSSRRGWTEKKMFGGIAFMLNEKMCCGVVKDDLLVRVGPDRNAEALSLPNSRPMDFTGKPMKGFVYVNAKGWSDGRTLNKWIDMAVEFVTSLPRKP